MKKGISLMLIVGLIVGIGMFFCSCGSDADSYDSQVQALADDIVANGELKIEKDEYGDEIAVLTVENTTDYEIESMDVWMKLYDKDESVVEETVESAYNWKAGEKHKFQYDIYEDYETAKIDKVEWY